MPNLNEFHALRGFLCGLHPDYEEYVRPKNPRTLDEAVELAQIYDDVQRKKKGKRSLSSDSFSGPSSGYKKTFFKKKDQKETNPNGNKRFKSPSGHASKSNSGSKGKFLSRKDYEKAKKDKLCFHCMDPNHDKANCPLLKSFEGDKSSAEAKTSRQAHLVQKLSLSPDSDEFTEITVSHTHMSHSYNVTKAMWTPTFGPHDLVRMLGTINGRKVRIMIDDGATHNFLNYNLVKKLNIKETKSAHKY